MKTENAAACANKQKMSVDLEKQAIQNTPDQTTPSEEDCKPLTSKQEPMEEELPTNEEEKKVNEKMEVDLPEVPPSNDEKGTFVNISYCLLNLLDVAYEYIFQLNN